MEVGGGRLAELARGLRARRVAHRVQLVGEGQPQSLPRFDMESGTREVPVVAVGVEPEVGEGGSPDGEAVGAVRGMQLLWIR